MKIVNILAVVAVICLGQLTTKAENSVPRDWAKFSRYAEANASIKKAPKAVLYGNSITDFWIGKDEEFFIKNDFLDRGVSGQTTSEMLVRFRQDVINLHPKAVAIMAGIKDIAKNNGEILLENAFGNIVSMVELAKVNRINVVLCSVLPCDSFKWRPELKPAENVKKLNKMIEQYALANNIPFVNYYSAMAMPNGALNPELTKDGCHPTLDGYKIMEKMLLPIINKAVK